MDTEKDSHRQVLANLLPILYLFGRIVIFLGLLPPLYYGYGDLPRYFEIASLDGWPFLSYWVEYPPIFPFLNSLVYAITNGQEFIYGFAITILISIAGAASIYLFCRLSCEIYGQSRAIPLSIIYFAILMPLSYTWWYFDLIGVFFTLCALSFLIINQSDSGVALSIALGMLTKWFPLFVLVPIWKYLGRKRALVISTLSLGIVISMIGILLIASPRLTIASLLSQPGRTSWETIWALLDGNYAVGSLVPYPEARYNPSLLGLNYGNPPLISPKVTLCFFVLIGLWMYFRISIEDAKSLISFVGLTWVLFLTWSPGWSPQWVLYLLPLILLSLPLQKGLLYCCGLTVVTFLEWPLLMNVDPFIGTVVTAPLRTLIFCFLILEWYRLLRSRNSPTIRQRLLKRLIGLDQ